MQKPIFLNHISLSFPNKICFEDFSAQIMDGCRIAVIGNNGSGKSTLLKIIKGDFEPSEGEILNNKNLNFGYVGQLIYDYENLSGGQKFNKCLSAALVQKPDILMLDEPTNHLDLKNRRSLMKMLEFYRGTLLIVSHDEELLKNCVNTIWHIEGGRIKIFNGKYDDYIRDLKQKRLSLQNQLADIKREKKESHKSLMKEQQRAAHSKQRGEKLVEQKRWLPAVGDLKASSARKTAGAKQADLSDKRQALNEALLDLHIAYIIKPKFHLNAKIETKTILSISGGSARYDEKIILKDINLNLDGDQHLAVIGGNGSGKTTLFKAILNYPQIIKTGFWSMPDAKDIGYLDQYYSDLNNEDTVYETISKITDWKQEEIRDFLNDFLFKKNEEVHKKVFLLSGGERARLCLAKIAAKTPKLLLLDEITNNIDLETKTHIEQILSQYPGAMLIISHEPEFLEKIGIKNYFDIK
ncbi:MAG: ATP-binding cassette domain-containing protein [Elusimicrobiota bacterium]|jgi:ATPase subunit of ABC transporter with duplicated ATPase domains|nr:ATP-binding cassette domain-containing protein [Elusimicrobiota bacterium]